MRLDPNDWTDRRAQLYIIAQVMRWLPAFERARPYDDRPRDLLDLARDCVLGDPDHNLLRGAIYAAATAARTQGDFCGMPAQIAEAAAWAGECVLADTHTSVLDAANHALEILDNLDKSDDPERSER